MAYILRRTDQGGGYVAPAGSPKSYTRSRARARRYASKAAAERDRCKGNEVIERAGD